jgi:hypothetical protein
MWKRVGGIAVAVVAATAIAVVIYIAPWGPAVAARLSPVGQILGVLGAIVALAIYLRKLIRAVGEQAQEAVDESKSAARSAREANTQATAAGVAAGVAGRHAEAATLTSLDTNKAMEWLVTELVAKDEALARSLIVREYLKERVDTAVAAVAYQAAERHGGRETDPNLEETEAIMITGRHSLRGTE